MALSAAAESNGLSSATSRSTSESALPFSAAATAAIRAYSGRGSLWAACSNADAASAQSPLHDAATPFSYFIWGPMVRRRNVRGPTIRPAASTRRRDSEDSGAPTLSDTKTIPHAAARNIDGTRPAVEASNIEWTPKPKRIPSSAAPDLFTARSSWPSDSRACDTTNQRADPNTTTPIIPTSTSNWRYPL